MEYKFHFHFYGTGEIIEQNVKFDFDGIKGRDRLKMINSRFGYFKRSIIHYENKYRQKFGYMPVIPEEYRAWYELIEDEDFDVLDPDKVNDLDVMDPVDYIDKYGVTFFGDRED